MLNYDLFKNKILVIGASGLLGQRTVNYFVQEKANDVLAASFEAKSIFDSKINYSQLDITKRDDVKNLVTDFCPDVIINCAAFTNVDLAEKERELCWKINVRGVEYLSEAARFLDLSIIHISTDYVFDGTKGPYSEIDKVNPIGYYARTKLASENVLKISGVSHLILRTNVLYGLTNNARPDFVQWVVSSLKAKKEIRIVTDQINNPTYIDDLVSAIASGIKFKKSGIYHTGGREFLSRYQFTLRIAKFFNLDESLIIPITTSQLEQAAKRPLKSGLITIKAESEMGFKPLSIEETFTIMKKEINL